MKIGTQVKDLLYMGSHNRGKGIIQKVYTCDDEKCKCTLVDVLWDSGEETDEMSGDVEAYEEG